MHVRTEPSWWQRNLKWVIAVAILAGALAMAAMIGVIAYVVSSAMRSSDVYVASMERARTHPVVLERLGTPIEPSWFFTGNMEVNPRSGSADLAIPISGPRGEATVGVVARKQAGTWYYDLMQLESEGMTPVDLRSETQIEAAARSR